MKFILSLLVFVSLAALAQGPRPHPIPVPPYPYVYQIPFHHCYGGSKCAPRVAYARIPSGYVSSVQVFAHDNIGDSHDAKIDVSVGGVYCGRMDVKKHPSYTDVSCPMVYVYPGQFLELSVPGKDEAMIITANIYYQ
jgi:hypothetical protein